jgi:methionine--tRNA ligase beta chain
MNEESAFVDMSFFKQMDLRVARIIKAEPIPGAKKLLKLDVDLGNEPRVLVAGIAEEYSCEALTDKLVVIVANMKPVKLMGVESRGMVLAAVVNGKPVLVTVMDDVAPGTPVA